MNHNDPQGKTLRLLRINNPELGPQFKDLTVSAADLGTPCMQAPELWWGDDPDEQALAIEGCQKCPIQQKCLDWAVAAHEREGVWGGVDPTERRLMIRRRDSNARNKKRREITAARAAELNKEESKVVEGTSSDQDALSEFRKQVQRERGTGGRSLPRSRY